MPQRHSKNSGSHTYGVFSYRERQNCGFMQKQEARLGQDSQLPFGHCWLSLQPAVDPVVTPSGHTYSREYLLEHMSLQGEELKRRRGEWEKEQRDLERREEAQSKKQRLAETAAFQRANDPLQASARRIIMPSSSSSQTTRGALVVAPSASALSTEVVLPKSLPPPESRLREVGKPDAMFWLPQHAPVAPKRATEEPPKRPASPVTGAPLRVKDLVSLPLTRADSKKVVTTNAGDDVRYLCHVSGDEITTQPVLFIRSTGCVVLEAVAKRLNVLDSKVCPVTSRKFKEKDVIKLVSGKSAYAASGGTELLVKKHRATGGGA